MNWRIKQHNYLWLMALLLLCTSSASFAQNDHGNVEYVVPPGSHYVAISSYSEGRARVSISPSGHFFQVEAVGYIDRSGSLVFKGKYAEAGDFHNGRAYVAKSGFGGPRYGFVNKKGELVIPFQYERVKNFSSNRALVNNNGRWMVINRQGETVFSDSRLITSTQPLLKPNAFIREIPVYHDGLLLTRKYDEAAQKDKYGFVDISGKVVIPYKYDVVYGFQDGVAIGVNEVWEKIDRVEAARKKLYGDLYDNFWSKIKYYKYKIIDTDGNVLYHFPRNQTPNLTDGFSGGYISFNIETQSGRKLFGVMGKTGNIIIPPQYSSVPVPFSNGVTIVQLSDYNERSKDSYAVVIDSTGNVVSHIPSQTEYGPVINIHSQFHEGLLAAEVETQSGESVWGYISKEGSFVIEPQFSRVWDFQEGRAVVITDDREYAVIKNPLKN